jgi:hypothetical protein
MEQAAPAPSAAGLQVISHGKDSGFNPGKDAVICPAQCPETASTVCFT